MNNNPKISELHKAVSDYCSHLDTIHETRDENQFHSTTATASISKDGPTVTTTLDRYTLLFKIRTVFQSWSHEEHSSVSNHDTSRLLFRVLCNACEIVIQYWWDPVSSSSFMDPSLPIKIPLRESRQARFKSSVWRHALRDNDDAKLMILAMEILNHAWIQLPYPLVFHLLHLRFHVNSSYATETNHSVEIHENTQQEINRDHHHCQQHKKSIGLVDILILLLSQWDSLDESLLLNTWDTNEAVRGNSRNRDSNHTPSNLSHKSSIHTTTTSFHPLALKTLVYAMQCGEFLQRYCTTSLHHLPTCEIDSCIGRGLGSIYSVQNPFICQALETLIHLMMDATSHGLNTLPSPSAGGMGLPLSRNESLPSTPPKLSTGNALDCYEPSRGGTTPLLLWIEFLSVVLRVGIIDMTSQSTAFRVSATKLVSSLAHTIQSTSSFEREPLSSSLEPHGLSISCFTLFLLLHWRMDVKPSSDIYTNVGSSKRFFQAILEIACLEPTHQGIYMLTVSLLVSLCMTQNEDWIHFYSVDNASWQGILPSFMESLKDPRKCHSIQLHSQLLLVLHLHDLFRVVFRKQLLLHLIQDKSNQRVFVKALVLLFAESSSFTTSTLALSTLKLILLEHPSQQLVDELSQSSWGILEEMHVVVLEMMLKKCYSSISTATGMKINIESFISLDALNLLCKSPVYSLAILRNMLANEARSDSSSAVQVDINTPNRNGSHVNPLEREVTASKAATGVDVMNFSAFFTLILNEITSTILCPQIGTQHTRIIDESLRIIQLANTIVYSLVLGRVCSAPIDDNAIDIMTFKIKVKKTVQLLYASSTSNCLGPIDAAFKQALSRDLTRRALQWCKIVSTWTAEGESSLVSFIFSSTFVQEQQSNKVRSQEEMLHTMTKVVDDLRKDRDAALHNLLARRIEENAMVSRSIVIAKAEALEIAELQALGRRMAETKLLQCEDKLKESECLVQQLREERESLTHDRSKLQTEVSSLLITRELLEEQNRTMKIKQDELITDLSHKSTNEDELNQRIAAVTAISNGLDMDKACLQDKLEEGHMRTVILEQELEEAHFHLVSLAKLYEYQEKALETSQKDNENIKSKYTIALEKIHDKLSHLQRTNTQLQEKNSSLELNIRKLQDENAKRKPSGPISYLNSMHNMHENTAMRTKHR